MDKIRERLYDVYDASPKIDVHTHLPHSSPSARSTGEILLYHMVFSEIFAAGGEPNEDFWRQRWLDPDDALAASLKIADIFPSTRNTALHRAAKAIGQDLYGIQEKEINETFIHEVHEATTQDKDPFDWAQQVIDRIAVKHLMAPVFPGRPTAAPDGKHLQAIHPSLEMSIFESRPGDPFPFELLEEHLGPLPDSRESLTNMIETFMGHMQEQGVMAQVRWFIPQLASPDYDENALDSAIRKLSRKEEWDRDERKALLSFEMNCRIEWARKHSMPFQICIGAGFVEGRGYSVPLLPDGYVESYTSWIKRYPDVPIDILNCHYAAEPWAIAMARTQPNVSLSGIWWHAMSEGWIEDVMFKRIQSVPITNLTAFFSDAYCIEWVYGKHIIMRRGMVEAFRRAIETEVFSLEEAEEYIRIMLYDTPKRVFLPGE